MDLSLKLAGVELRNPLVVLSGTPGNNGKTIREIAKHAVGAITTKSMYVRRRPVVYQPYMAKIKNGLINADWTDIGVRRWIEKDMKIATQSGVPVIASVGLDDFHMEPPPVDTPLDDFQDVLLKLEKAGAAMIQLAEKGDLAIRTLRLAKETVDIPVIQKLGFYEPDLATFVQEVEAAGADIITSTGSLTPCFAIDIETGEPVLGSPDGTGGLSGPAIKPYSLTAVTRIAAVAKVPLIGSGGVTTAEDVIEMIMAGSTGVGLCTAVMLQKAAVLDKIDSNIKKFMERKGISALSEIRGITVKCLKTRRKIQLNTYPSMISHVEVELCNACGTCRDNCPYNAIEISEAARIDDTLCHGCGICISVCPTRALSLRARALR